MREFLTNPILRDNGGNLCLQEGPDSPQKVLVFLTQGRANSLEIAIGLRKLLLCRHTHSFFLLIGSPLRIMHICRPEPHPFGLRVDHHLPAFL